MPLSNVYQLRAAARTSQRVPRVLPLSWSSYVSVGSRSVRDESFLQLREQLLSALRVGAESDVSRTSLPSLLPRTAS